MSHVVLASFHPYPCPSCGILVRTINMSHGGLAIIDSEPSPSGNIAPWPAESPNALAVGRLMDPPINDGPMWAMHLCR